MFSLSYYDFPLLREWFSPYEYVWEKKEFAKAAAAKSGKKQNMGEELLIMNLNLTRSQKNGTTEDLGNTEISECTTNESTPDYLYYYTTCRFTATILS